MKSINEVLSTFKYGNFVHSYYRFLDKFHAEPKDWADLFEYFDFCRVEGKINEIVNNMSGVKNG